jgi:hypothetical protein
MPTSSSEKYYLSVIAVEEKEPTIRMLYRNRLFFDNPPLRYRFLLLWLKTKTTCSLIEPPLFVDDISSFDITCSQNHPSLNQQLR